MPKVAMKSGKIGLTCFLTPACAGRTLNFVKQGQTYFDKFSSLKVPRWLGVIFIALSLVAICLRDAPWSKTGAMITWAYVPFLLLGVWSIIPARRWPGWLTGAAFPVYVMHMLMFMFVGFGMKGVGKVLKFVDSSICRFVDLGLNDLWMSITSRESLCGYIVFIALSFAGCVAVAAVLRRICPKTAAVLFGGR